MNTWLLCLALALGFGCTGNVGDDANGVVSQGESLKGGIPANAAKRVPVAPEEDEDVAMDEPVDGDSISDETVDGESVSEDSLSAESMSAESVSDESISEESISDPDTDPMP